MVLVHAAEQLGEKFHCCYYFFFEYGSPGTP